MPSFLSKKLPGGTTYPITPLSANKIIVSELFAFPDCVTPLLQIIHSDSQDVYTLQSKSPP